MYTILAENVQGDIRKERGNNVRKLKIIMGVLLVVFTLCVVAVVGFADVGDVVMPSGNYKVMRFDSEDGMKGAANENDFVFTRCSFGYDHSLSGMMAFDPAEQSCYIKRAPGYSPPSNKPVKTWCRLYLGTSKDDVSLKGSDYRYMKIKFKVTHLTSNAKLFLRDSTWAYFNIYSLPFYPLEDDWVEFVVDMNEEFVWAKPADVANPAVWDDVIIDKTHEITLHYQIRNAPYFNDPIAEEAKFYIQYVAFFEKEEDARNYRFAPGGGESFVQTAKNDLPPATPPPVAGSGALDLFSNGTTDYRIVIGANANTFEKHAADIVKRHFELVTGAPIQIVTDDAAPQDCEIVVGDTNREALDEISFDRSSSNGRKWDYKIFAANKRIYLLGLGGSNNSGVAQAAYRFSEEILGYDYMYARISSTYDGYRVTQLTVPTDYEVEHSVLSLSAAKIPTYQGETVIYQLPQTDTGCVIGESYIIRTRQGKIYAIDGGFASELDNIIAAVKALTPEGEKPTIDGWFISHPHPDHSQALTNYLDNYSAYADKLQVNAIYGGLLEPGWYATNVKYPLADSIAQTIRSAETTTGGKTVYRALNTGDHIYADEVDFWIMYTGDPTMTSVHGQNVNSTGLVIKMTVGNESCLFLNDGEFLTGKYLLNNYTSDQLRADIVQIAHHGVVGVQLEVYERTGARKVFLPETYAHWLSDGGWGLNTWNPDFEHMYLIEGMRRYLIRSGFSKDDIYASWQGITAYRFGNGIVRFGELPMPINGNDPGGDNEPDQPNPPTPPTPPTPSTPSTPSDTFPKPSATSPNQGHVGTPGTKVNVATGSFGISGDSIVAHIIKAIVEFFGVKCKA